MTDEWTVFSVGGGALAEEGHDKGSTPEIYDMNRMSEILYWCERTGRNYWEYVQQCEDEDIWDYLAEVWKTMREAIERGLDQEGVLPGPLNLRRKASTYYIKAKGYKDNLRSRGLVFSYALAVSEEKRLRWQNRHSPYLRIMRSGSGCTLSLAKKAVTSAICGF